MNIEIFAVYDSAAERHLDPFTGPTIEFAIRGFREACTTDGHQFKKFPEDYVLYHVGTFDTVLGQVTGMPNTVKLAIASQWANEWKHHMKELKGDDT